MALACSNGLSDLASGFKIVVDRIVRAGESVWKIVFGAGAPKLRTAYHMEARLVLWKAFCHCSRLTLERLDTAQDDGVVAVFLLHQRVPMHAFRSHKLFRDARISTLAFSEQKQVYSFEVCEVAESPASHP